MKDLFYTGIQNLTLDDAEELKKQQEIKQRQAELYSQGAYNNIYPAGTPEEKIVDGVWGPKTEKAVANSAIPKMEPQNIDNVGEPTQAYKDNPNYSNPYKVDSYDQWLKDSGMDQLPELQPFNDEKRIDRANKQQNAYNLAQALRSLAQAGFAGDNAMFNQRFEPDRTTPRIQNELQNIRNAYDADVRQSKLTNLSNDVRKLGLYNQYVNQQEAYRQQDKNLDKRMKMQADQYRQTNENWNRRYGQQTDPEYLQAVQDIKTKAAIDLAKATTEIQRQTIQDQMAKEITVAGIKGGYSMDQINAIIAGEGSFDKPINQTNKEPHLIVTVDGKEQGLSKAETKSQAYGIKENLSKLKQTAPDQYESLPDNIKFILLNPDAMSQDEADALVYWAYSIKEGEKTSTTGGAGKYTGGTSKAGKYTSGSK